MKRARKDGVPAGAVPLHGNLLDNERRIRLEQPAKGRLVQAMCILDGVLAASLESQEWEASLMTKNDTSSFELNNRSYHR